LPLLTVDLHNPQHTLQKTFEQPDYIGIMKDLVIFYLLLWALSALVLVIILHPESSNVYV